MTRRLLIVLFLALLVLTPAIADQKSVTKTLQVNHRVDLSWAASPSTVVGYNIYRAGVSGGPYSKLGSVSGLTYNDTIALAGKTYFYVVTAVDTNNVESVNSNEVSATAPTP